MHFAANDARLDRIDPALIERVRAMTRPYDRFIELVDALIDRNPKLSDAVLADSPAQRAIAAVAALDIQIQNGGLMQFFWNCPGLAEHVAPALRLVGVPALAEHYDQAIEQLAGNVDRLVEQREAGGLGDFMAAADENDFEGFETIYFGDYDRASDRWSGLVDYLYERSATFMLENIDAFVLPSGRA